MRNSFWSFHHSGRIREVALALLTLLMGVLMACGTLTPAGPKIRAENAWSRPALAMTEMEGASGEGTEGGMAMERMQSEGGAEGEMQMEQGMGNTGVIYLTVVNDGRAPDRLLGAHTDVAATVELHRTSMEEGGVMKMQPITGGVEVPARSRVVFEPAGAHLMLIGLKRDLKVGDRFTVVLEFEKSGTLTVEAEVRAP